VIAWLTGKPDALAARPGTREAAWEAAFRANILPSFVANRLHSARVGAAPWTTTGSPAELLLIRRLGIHPVAIVSGTCWFKCGHPSGGSPARGLGFTDYRGRATVAGWHLAIARIQEEARQAGAHIVVDTQLRSAMGDAGSREYTLVGTALRVEGIDVGSVPLVTTMSGLATLRLLVSGVVPTGIAVGAAAQSITAPYGSPGSASGFLAWRGAFKNTALQELTELDRSVRRAALANLMQGVGACGNQLLAHDISGKLERLGRNSSPPVYLARYTVVATVIDASRARPPAGIGTQLTMNDVPLPPVSRGAIRV
jgi:hypothetical protein